MQNPDTVAHVVERRVRLLPLSRALLVVNSHQSPEGGLTVSVTRSGRAGARVRVGVPTTGKRARPSSYTTFGFSVASDSWHKNLPFYRAGPPAAPRERQVKLRRRRGSAAGDRPAVPNPSDFTHAGGYCKDGSRWYI